MRYALVFLLGVVLGSVVAVATTTFLAAQRPAAAAPAPNTVSTESFGKAFEDAVARALRRVESEAAAARDSLSASGETDSAPPSGSKSQRQRRVSADLPAASADAGETISRDAATPLREKDADRLQALIVRSKGAEATRRRDWLFLSEAAVEKALGMPDHISPNDNGTETWSYEVEFTNHNNEAESGRLHLEFNRGRVIRIDGADDIPE